MKVTLEAVARAIDGTVVGDGSVEITGVAGIREAREGDLTFLANPRYEPYLELTQASAVIVSENHRNIGKPLIQNPNPYLAFLKAVRFFAGDAERPCSGIHPTAVIAPDAVVAEDASIGPHAVIEPGAKIGSRTTSRSGRAASSSPRWASRAAPCSGTTWSSRGRWASWGTSRSATAPAWAPNRESPSP